MALVSDTSPISYLILIGRAEILGVLYEEVSVPPAVEEELRDPEGPGPIRQWSEDPPAWLQVEEGPQEAPPDLDPGAAKKLRSLDRGERQAIQLAKAKSAPLLAIDERDGRRVSKEMGLRITGTLGLLDEAASEGLVDARRAADRLRETSFRASSELYQWLITRHT